MRVCGHFVFLQDREHQHSARRFFRRLFPILNPQLFGVSEELLCNSRVSLTAAAKPLAQRLAWLVGAAAATDDQGTSDIVLTSLARHAVWSCPAVDSNSARSFGLAVGQLLTEEQRQQAKKLKGAGMAATWSEYMRDAIETMDAFLRQSPLGEFLWRLQLVRALGGQLRSTAVAVASAMMDSFEDVPASVIVALWCAVANVADYFEQFAGIVAEVCGAARVPIEKELKVRRGMILGTMTESFMHAAVCHLLLQEQAKLAKWDEQSYYSLRETSIRTKKLLFKTVTKYSDALSCPAQELIEAVAAGEMDSAPKPGAAGGGMKRSTMMAALLARVTGGKLGTVQHDNPLLRLILLLKEKEDKAAAKEAPLGSRPSKADSAEEPSKEKEEDKEAVTEEESLEEQLRNISLSSAFTTVTDHVPRYDALDDHNRRPAFYLAWPATALHSSASDSTDDATVGEWLQQHSSSLEAAQLSRLSSLPTLQRRAAKLLQRSFSSVPSTEARAAASWSVHAWTAALWRRLNSVMPMDVPRDRRRMVRPRHKAPAPPATVVLMPLSLWFCVFVSPSPAFAIVVVPASHCFRPSLTSCDPARTRAFAMSVASSRPSSMRRT